MKNWPHCRLHAWRRWKRLLFALPVCVSCMLPAVAETAPQMPAPTKTHAAQAPVRYIFHDQQGTSWIATNDNVQRLAGDLLEVIPSVGGVSDEIVAPFADDGHGGVFFLT